jgi:hypothetical protein
MTQNLSKVRNQTLQMVKAKAKKIEAGFGITKEDKNRAVACDYVIDPLKVTAKNKNPRLTD